MAIHCLRNYTSFLPSREHTPRNKSMYKNSRLTPTTAPRLPSPSNLPPVGRLGYQAPAVRQRASCRQHNPRKPPRACGKVLREMLNISSTAKSRRQRIAVGELGRRRFGLLLLNWLAGVRISTFIYSLSVLLSVPLETVCRSPILSTSYAREDAPS